MLITEEMNQLVPLMDQRSREIESLFSSIEQDTQSILELPPSEKFKLILATEYKLLALRVKLSSEQCTVKKILTSPSQKPSVSLVSIFKMRDTYLASALQRLNEIQEGVSLLQRSEYFLSNQNVYKSN